MTDGIVTAAPTDDIVQLLSVLTFLFKLGHELKFILTMVIVVMMI